MNQSQKCSIFMRWYWSVMNQSQKCSIFMRWYWSVMNQSQKCSIFMRWYWWTNHRNVQYLWGDTDEPITEMFNIYEVILMNQSQKCSIFMRWYWSVMNQSQKCSIFMRWYWWTNHRNVQYLWGDTDEPITEMFNIYEVILMNQSQKCSIFMRWYWWTNHRNVQYLWGDTDEPITEMFNIYEVILMNQSQKCKEDTSGFIFTCPICMWIQGHPYTARSSQIFWLPCQEDARLWSMPGEPLHATRLIHLFCFYSGSWAPHLWFTALAINSVHTERCDFDFCCIIRLWNNIQIMYKYGWALFASGFFSFSKDL